ncbi:unnamed protein product [Fraxinus pennsylvanica]|uniref:Peptidoglycan binding-like domain-containing protein n=1 Tax=Fraxinus pennsylvanica TaxID=56036 RepID=A0AAD2E5Y3_9LAMI|nr:unnamed protein product [Fraxinus pennsylvanica]
MAVKISHIFSCVFLLLLLLFVSCHAKKTVSPSNKKPLPFDFLKHLEGCHKGEKTKDIHKLKKYLEKYGYLDYHHSRNKTHENDDEFDDILESAVKLYQFNYHINATGVLDSETVSNMMKPRCGVADIVNGTSIMRAGGRKDGGSGSLHTVSQDETSMWGGRQCQRNKLNASRRKKKWRFRLPPYGVALYFFTRKP